MATSNVAPNYQWYHDTGCNHHLTNELANLNVCADDYPGSDHIRVGDDLGLRILHSGIAT
jgi:hypothetical protein